MGQNGTIKAIETRYKGYRFRSRLEARYAVFFDTLGIKWEYEKEGYDLGDAGWYLPDFYVTYPGRGKDDEYSCWIEVKPTPPADLIIRQHNDGKIDSTDKHHMFAKCIAPLILVTGMPDFRAYDRFVVIMATSMEFINGELTPSDHEQEYLDIGEVLLWSSRGRIWSEPSNTDIETHCRENKQYNAAVNAARAARFEHGERG